MPELPEVETIVRGLQELIGRKVSAVEVYDDKIYASQPAPGALFQLVGQSVVRVTRRGKVIVLDTDGGLVVSCHLRMTGQLWLVPAGAPVPRFVRVKVHFVDVELYFADARRFGYFVVETAAQFADNPFLARLGPDAATISASELAVRLKHRSGSVVKAALLDQTVLAGVGNIYADEALWRAGIHPETRCGDLDEDAVTRLAEAIVYVLARGIETGGSSLRDYVDASGTRGRYLDEAGVFARQGQACRRCGAQIIKTRVAGRGTHLCLNCQRVS